MNISDKDAIIDVVIDLMAELGMLEMQIRELREGLEPMIDSLFYTQQNR